MEDTHTMKKPRVGSARINEIRKSELFDSSETLKRTGLDNAPEHTLNLRPLDIELDEVVQWIANPLLLGHSAESPLRKQTYSIEQTVNKFNAHLSP